MLFNKDTIENTTSITDNNENVVVRISGWSELARTK